MNVAKSVLVVDDEAGMQIALRANFEREGWRVEVASGAHDAISKFRRGTFSLVVTDVRMPGGDGLQVMRSVKQLSPSTAVIMLTAFGSVPEAVEAVRSGACDYLIKPVSFEQLQASVARVTRASARLQGGDHSPASDIIGNSPALLRALERARHAAQADADVLIEAESGTGKELMARYIHETSERRNKPFVAVNCAAVPELLLESELFGHARGAFTGAVESKPGRFELANGGTILLDEIGEMPLRLQPKLLRALQEREFERVGDTRTQRVDIRVIATTNVSLQKMVEEGDFRADLYYRLNVIPVSLPPLRERREDIPVLAQFFASKFACHAGLPEPLLSAELLARLQSHSWPGNIRELSNVMRRVVALGGPGESGPEYLDSDILRITPERSPRTDLLPGSSMRTVERSLLESTLKLTQGNRTHAAELLGVSLRTVRNKIREYGLPPRRYA